MRGKDILYLILFIILMIVLGPTIVTVLGTLISGIFFIILIVVLGLLGMGLYAKHKFKKEMKKMDQDFEKYNSTVNNTYTNDEDDIDSENPTIIDVDFEEEDEKNKK